VLRRSGRLAVWVADAVAVLAATLVSWALHGLITFPDDPAVAGSDGSVPTLWTASLALFVDVAVITMLDSVLRARLVGGVAA
jgi:putative flippase GtrA